MWLDDLLRRQPQMCIMDRPYHSLYSQQEGAGTAAADDDDASDDASDEDAASADDDAVYDAAEL